MADHSDKSEDMHLLDASGTPIPKPVTWRQRWAAASSKTKALAVSLVALVAATATISTNLRTIKDYFQEAPPQPVFEITDVLSTPNASGGSWNLDFRLLNNLEKTVTVSRIQLTAVSYYYSPPPPAHLMATATYEIDLQPLTKTGAVIEHPISHELKPLEADRFTVVIGLDKFHELELHSWRILPTLITSEGDMDTKEVEIQIPAR